MIRLRAIFLGLMLLIPAAAQGQLVLPNINDYADHWYTTEVGIAKVPSLGKSRILVIPLTIESSFDWTNFLKFFDNDASGFTFRNFFKLQSLGRYDVETVIAQPIHFDKCPVDVPKCQFTELGHVQAAFEFVTLIFERLALQNIDFSQIDLNGADGKPDGWADGVLIITPNYAGGVAPPVYPFYKQKPDQVIEYNGVKVGSIGISEADTFTAIHEFGHLLGSADLYTIDLEYSFMSWCDDCFLDALTRLKLGWANVIQVESTKKTYTIKPVVTSGDVYVFGDLNSKEYFLLENRQEYQLGDVSLDRGLDGLALYHVDYKLGAPILAQYIGQTGAHRFLVNVKPTNNPEKGGLFKPGDYLWPTLDHAPWMSAPDDSNWWNGKRSGVRIDNVVDAGKDSDGLKQYSVELTGVNDDKPGTSDATVIINPGGEDANDGSNDPDAVSSPDSGGDTGGGTGGSSGCSVAGSGNPAPFMLFGLLLMLLLIRRRSSDPARG